MDSFTNKTRAELILICKEKQIKGYSGKRRDDIIELLRSTAGQTAPENTINNTIKPFLKWVGGKSQIIEKVLAKFPRVINNYYEPFLGGGSVLLALLSAVRNGHIVLKGNIYASDLNIYLIGLYKNIQSAPTAFIAQVRMIIDEFKTITGATVNRQPASLQDALTSPESYYYWIRSQFNLLKEDDRGSIGASAMFLFMNKTCFRGVYREGPRGFNVPYGNYKAPAIMDENHILEISQLIKDVIFTAGTYTGLNVSGVGDFVYLDPPYAPESNTSFVSYTSAGFDLLEHTKLFTLCGELVDAGANILMSNTDVAIVKEAFPPPKYSAEVILCKRTINSKKPGEKTNELLISNNFD